MKHILSVSRYAKQSYRDILKKILTVLCFFFFASFFLHAEEDRELSLHIKNVTPFTVIIQQGMYGGTTVAEINPNQQKDIKVTHFLDDNKDLDFYYYFDVNYNSLSIKSIQSRDLFFTVKPFEKEHDVYIDLPREINLKKVGIIIKNESKKSLSLMHNNSMVSLKVYEKDIGNTIPANSVASFIKATHELSGKLHIYDSNLVFPEINYLEGYVYTFIVNEKNISLSDARPIIKIGENTWEIPFDNNTQISSLFEDDNNKCVYFSGSENKTAFIHSLDNKININQFDTDESSEDSFSGIIKFADSLIVTGRNNTSKVPYIIKYSTSGEKIGSNVYFEQFVEVKPFLCNNDLFIAGLATDRKNISITLIKNGKKLGVQKNISDISVEDVIGSFVTVFDKHSSTIFCAINFENDYSNVYRININTGDISQIDISDNFIDISSIHIDAGSNIYFIGTKDNYRTSIINLIETTKTYSERIVYSFTEKNVLINDSIIKDDYELILSGAVKSSAEIKSAFCMGINLKTSEILWQNQSFKFRNGEFTKITPYSDYGYIAAYNSLDNCGLIRLNSAGYIDDNHQLLESSISIKSDIAGVLYINGIKKRMISEDEIISFSLIPQNYFIELKDLQDNLIDYKEIVLKKNKKQKVILMDNSKLYLKKNNSNLSYRVVNNGRGIEILGSGEIQEAIWLSDIQLNEVESVIIDEGITSIGDGIFYKYKNLSYVRLPDSLESIGKKAFYYCDNLTTIIIPANLKFLGDEAFYGCPISSITIPADLNKIGTLVFSHCNKLKEIKVNENNTHYKDINGILFTKDETELIIYPPMKEDDKFIASENVQIIHENAFYSQNYVQEITLGANVRNIGNNAFSHCLALQKFNVINDNKWFNSIDGVLFNYSGSRLISYPYGKNDISKYTISKAVDIIEDNALTVKELNTIIFENETVPNIGHHDWKKRNSFRIVVPTKSYEDYINTKAFEPVQTAIITNSQYLSSIVNDFVRYEKFKRNQAVKDFFTPYDDWFSMEFGGYYGFSKFNVFDKVEYPNINFPGDCEWNQPRFGIKANLLFEGTGFECAFPYLDYSFTKTKLGNDNLTYNQLDVGIMLGPNIKRRVALKTGFSFTMLWESRQSDIALYSDGTSFKIGFTVPVDLTIRITKFLSIYGEYKWSLLPNQALERRFYNTGIMINTTF